MHLHPQNDTERAKHQNILVFQRTVYCLRFKRCRPTKCIRMKFDREIKSTLKCVCKTTTTATSESYKTKAPANPSAGLKWIEEKEEDSLPLSSWCDIYWLYACVVSSPALFFGCSKWIWFRNIYAALDWPFSQFIGTILRWHIAISCRRVYVYAIHSINEH